MAAIDDVNAAIAKLKDAMNTALQHLAGKADTNSLSGGDVLTVIDQLNTEHDAVVAAVAAVDTPATPAAPAAPTDPTAPAAPVDPTAPATPVDPTAAAASPATS